MDEEFLSVSLDFMDRRTKEGAPWFCYFNTTRMHIFTHLKPSSVGKTGLGIYPDGMVELDGYVGQLLKKLEDLGVAVPRREGHARRRRLARSLCHALAGRHQAGPGHQ